ncbi:MAG: hypothetical protein D6706_02075 [Chloroflexi bacterium]|nr:MAG: hypothetical protein D6706_02075 [Chloroflexota bacterium]
MPFKRAGGLLLALFLAAVGGWLLLRPMAAAAAGNGVGQEMLVNGDFSQGLTGWTHYGQMAIESAWTPRGNGYGRACWTSSGCYAIYQGVYLWPGDYQLSFYIPTVTNFGLSIWFDEQLTQLFYTPQNLAGGGTNSRIFTVETGGMYWLSTYTGASAGDWVGDISIIALSPDPNAQPPAAAGAGYCTFTSTITSTVATITGTVEIAQSVTYTRSQNIVPNPSFELVDFGKPLSWQAVGTFNSGAVGILDDVSWWRAGEAYDGSRYASAAGIGLVNDMPLYSGGNYVAGFYARCPGGGCTDEVAMSWGGSPVASIVPSDTWTLITGTHTTGGGSAWLQLDFGGLGPLATLQVDNVIAYPVDENGEPICDPSFYEPYNPAVDGAPPVPVPTGDGGSIPVPIGGAAGAVCYSCPIPTNMLSIGGWIGYLACIIKNLFSCSLRSWLFNIVNVVYGVWRIVLTMINWLPGMVQIFANWLLSLAAGLVSWWWGWLSDLITWWYSLVTNSWGLFGRFVSMFWAAQVDIFRQLVINFLQSDFAQAIWRSLYWGRALWQAALILIETFLQSLWDMYQGIIEFVDFLVTVFGRIRDAFASPAIEISIVTDEGQTVSGLAPAELYASGANATKILWLFLSAISALDYLIGDFNLQIVLAAAVGVLAIGLIFWTMKLWHDIIPI